MQFSEIQPSHKHTHTHSQVQQKHTHLHFYKLKRWGSVLRPHLHCSTKSSILFCYFILFKVNKEQSTKNVEFINTI